jgi:hypothetical protein
MRLVLLGVLSSIVLVFSASAQTLCPDGSYVSKGPCQLCPDGGYVGGGGPCSLTPKGDYVPKRPGGSRLAPDGSYVGD